MSEVVSGFLLLKFEDTGTCGAIFSHLLARPRMFSFPRAFARPGGGLESGVAGAPQRPLACYRNPISCLYEQIATTIGKQVQFSDDDCDYGIKSRRQSSFDTEVKSLPDAIGLNDGGGDGVGGGSQRNLACDNDRFNASNHEPEIKTGREKKYTRMKRGMGADDTE